MFLPLRSKLVKPIKFIVCIALAFSLYNTYSLRFKMSETEYQERFKVAKTVSTYIQANSSNSVLICENILLYQNICGDNFNVCDIRLYDKLDKNNQTDFIYTDPSIYPAVRPPEDRPPTAADTMDTIRAYREILKENIEYDHSSVTVTVPIYKTRELPLNVEFINVPRGFPIEQLGYTLSRNSILVASPSETIDNVDAITVGPIDFREIDIGTELTLDITLNAGLKNVENVTSVTVTFPTYGLSARTLDLDNFVFENVPVGVDITPLSDSIEDIRVVGDSSIIADLTQEDLVGIIDLSQYSLSRGRYTVSVKVYVQGKVLAWAVGEYSVSIDVVPKEVVSDTGN